MNNLLKQTRELSNGNKSQAQQYQALLFNPTTWHSTTISSIVQVCIPGSPHVVSCLNTDAGDMVGPQKVSLFEQPNIAVP